MPPDHEVVLEESRKKALELCEALGMTPKYYEVKKAFARLLGWVPECRFPLEIGVYNSIPDKDCPFLTESYLYELFGKEDARTLLALIHTLVEAAGIPRDEQWKIEPEGLEEW